MFAKLFDCPEYGQILVVRSTNKQGKPELRCMAEPDGFGVCEFAIGFPDSDAGWDSAEEALNNMNLKTAKVMAQQILKGVGA